MRNAASVSQLLHDSALPRGARMMRVVSMRVGALMTISKPAENARLSGVSSGSSPTLDSARAQECDSERRVAIDHNLRFISCLAHLAKVRSPHRARAVGSAAQTLSNALTRAVMQWRPGAATGVLRMSPIDLDVTRNVRAYMASCLGSGEFNLDRVQSGLARCDVVFAQGSAHACAPSATAIRPR